MTPAINDKETAMAPIHSSLLHSSFLARRPRARGLLLAAAALGALTWFSACDDDPAGPGDDLPFSFELTVKTGSAAPVRGLEIFLHVPLLLGEAPAAAKASTNVRFCVNEALDADLRVFDPQGQLVRTLLTDYPVQPGMHSVMFDGKDDQGEPVIGTALLDVRLELRDPQDGTLIEADRFPAVLYTGEDAEQRPLLGITDYQGRIVTAERRLFPFLYDPGDLIRYDENAEPMGAFTISDTVEVFINDPIAHLEATARFRIADGPNAFTMTWPPGAAAAAIPGRGPHLGTGRQAPRGSGTAAADIVDCEPDLIVYPNPFN